MSRQFIWFVAASGTAAAVNFMARLAFDVFLPYSMSIILAFFAGLTTAFVLNRQFVFTGGQGNLAHQAGWFVAINMVALLQTLAVSLALAKWLLPLAGWTWHPEAVAHAAGIAVPILSSYIGHRRLTFRDAPPPEC